MWQNVAYCNRSDNRKIIDCLGNNTSNVHFHRLCRAQLKTASVVAVWGNTDVDIIVQIVNWYPSVKERKTHNGHGNDLKLKQN